MHAQARDRPRAACCHLVAGGGRRARGDQERGRRLFCCPAAWLHLHAKPKGRKAAGQLLPEAERKRACSGDEMCEGDRKDVSYLLL